MDKFVAGLPDGVRPPHPVRSVVELNKLPGGDKLWAEYGTGYNGRIDLRDGSKASDLIEKVTGRGRGRGNAGNTKGG